MSWSLHTLVTLVLYIAAEKAEVDAYSCGEAEAVAFQICV